MKKLIILVGLILTACQSTPEPDPNSHWVAVNEIYWASMSDMPYPFTTDYGEIACDSYGGLELAYFYPDDMADDESKNGVPLTSDARGNFEKSGLRANVDEVFKSDVDFELLEDKVLGICRGLK